MIDIDNEMDMEIAFHYTISDSSKRDECIDGLTAGFRERVELVEVWNAYPEKAII